MKYVYMAPKKGTPLSLGIPGKTSSGDTDLNVRNPKYMNSPTAAVTAMDGFMSAMNSWRASGIMVAVRKTVCTVAKLGKAKLTKQDDVM